MRLVGWNLSISMIVSHCSCIFFGQTCLITLDIRLLRLLQLLRLVAIVAIGTTGAKSFRFSGPFRWTLGEYCVHQWHRLSSLRIDNYIERILGPFSYARYTAFLPLQNTENRMRVFKMRHCSGSSPRVFETIETTSSNSVSDTRNPSKEFVGGW